MLHANLNIINLHLC